MVAPNSHISIRGVSNKDFHRLLELLRQLGYEVAHADLEANFAAFSETDGHFAFVAEIKGDIVGFLSLSMLRWLHRTPTARITALVTEESRRGKGIGRALVSHAEKTALGAGCGQLSLTCSNHRAKTGAHDFYRELSYRDAAEESTYFRKELPPR